MLPAFKQYLTSLQLGPVSRKLYLADVRRFLSWLANQTSSRVEELTLTQVSSPKTYLDYMNSLKSVATAPSLLKRTTASLRQFGHFLTLTYSIPNPITHGSELLGVHNTVSNASDNYIKHFSKYLNESHLSPLTIKSYKSDVTRYLDWTTTHLASSKMAEVLSDKNIEKYLNHLSTTGITLPSTIERKSKSLIRFQVWYTSVYAPSHISDNSTERLSTSHYGLLDAQPTYSTASTTTQLLPTHQSSDSSKYFVKKINYRNLALMATLLLFTATLAVFGYRQFNRDVRLTAAYPSTPVTPNRQLSFQGRLEDAAGNPITTATDFVFKLYDDPIAGSELYSSGTCSIDPDSDGVFSTQIGSTCGAGITSDVFTHNADVWLEVTVGTSPSDEILDPRQQIATVAYALNSETIQGFPISSTVSAIRNTVVPMNQWGEIIVGEQSPRLTGVAGTFQISAPSLSLVTATGTNGNITLAPDGNGVVNVQGSTVSTTSFFNVSANQLNTGGTLIKGNANTNDTGFKLIDLFSGASPTSKFSVDYAGNTTMAGTLTLPNSNTLTGVTNYTQFSQGISVGGATTYYINSSGNLNANQGTFAGTLDANGQVDLGDGGDTITLNGSSLTLTGFNCTGNANGGALTTDGSGVLQCSDDDSGSSSGSNWRLNAGTISPNNDTLDLLVGANATASARAGFININSGTPTATLSAGTTGGAFLTADGYLSTTARQSLTLGNSSTYDSTGNILLNPNGTGNVGIGTTGPDAKLDSLSTTGEQLRLTYTDDSVYSGITLNSSGNLSIDNTGTKTTIVDDLEIVGDDLIMTTNTSGYLLIADGTNFNPTAVSGDITIDGTGLTAIGADKITENMLKSVNAPTDELCLSYESSVGDFEWQTCGSGGGGSNWRLNAGTISPNNDTLDLLVGANATASAKAGFININSGTPTATVSAGGTSGAFLTAAGTLGTTAKKTLTLGNSTTGNVVIAPGGVTALTGIGANLVAAGNLTLTAATNLIFGTTSLGETTAANDSGAYVVGTFDEFDNSNSLNVQDVLDDLDAGLTTALTGAGLWTDAGAYLHPTGGEVLGNSAAAGANKLAGIYLADSAPLTFGADNDFSFSFSGSTLGSTILPGTMLGINTTTGLATLDIRSSLGTIPVASISGDTSMASLIVDQSGIGDIFTASKSGDTKFVITNAGNVGIGVANPTNKLEIGGATSTISNSSGDITLDSASNFIAFSGDSIGNILNGYFAGEVGIGLSDAIAKLDVHGAVTGKALVMFDELGDQDLFTASASGVTRFRLRNDGSLTTDGDYLNFALTEGSSGYGIRDNAGVMEFKSLSGTWTAMGAGGASWWDQVSGTLQPYNKTVDLLLGGSATDSAKIALININSGTPTASISAGSTGSLYLNASGTIATTAKQTLALGDATTTGNIILQGGNVGIGVASPVEKLEVDGTVVAQIFADTAGSGAYYLDAASTGTSLSIEGNIVGNGAFYLSTGADATAVSIGTTGAGKLKAGTIDPPYTINGEKFATYMSGMTGVKEETTGTVNASEYVAGKGYRATLDLANSLKGSDLWIFTQTTSLQSKIDQLVVLTTAAGNTRTWYELDAAIGRLYLYSQTPTMISYRLTAPRFDASTWSNHRDPSDSLGFVVNNPTTWSVPTELVNLYTQISDTIQTTITNSLQTNVISPLASGSAITITQDPSSLPTAMPSGRTYEDQVDPLLLVDGTLDTATISARTAYLNDLSVENITAKNIVTDTIEANHIIGLDAKIASLSAGMSDEEFDSITDRIKDRLSTLSGNAPTAEDVPLPPENTDTVIQLDSPSLNSTASATISSADIDFATINNYLAVIGTATITSLDVTDNLYATEISSKTGLLALAEGTMIIDSTGHVAINGDLSVSGKILADSASLNTLELGSPASASTSATALGQLLAIYNESGETVATIDASGSANLDRLTTNMITIASPAVATSSAGLSELIGQASSNATAGVAKLNTPNTELTIESPYVTPNSLVYLTPTGNTDNKVLFVQSKVTCSEAVLAIDPSCRPSFTVGIDTPANSDISFNWWIIELAPTQTTPATEEQI